VGVVAAVVVRLVGGCQAPECNWWRAGGAGTGGGRGVG